jgi:NAD(P)-dependent dehydrogenase (short-subunit alcohol dehydrogenase family)
MLDEFARYLRFDGRVVLITGGARGIGYTITEAFLKSGCTVIVCGRTRPEHALSSEGREAEFVACDVRRADQVQEMVRTIASRHGQVNFVINNAGGSPRADTATASPRFSEAVVALNLLGPLYVAQAANALMQSQVDGGVIVNIASVAGIRPSPGTAAYGAAKAGLLNLTRSLAVEWGPKVRVNAVVPGLIMTEGARKYFGSDEALATIARRVPLGRLGTGQDVAAAVLYLVSPLAAYINGAHLTVDGGGEIPFSPEHAGATVAGPV